MNVLNRKITIGTKEWAEKNINFVIGCSNNCRYCYAKLMAKRFRGMTEASWVNMKIRSDVVYKKHKKYGGVVMIPSSHDVVNDPKILKACMAVLENLLNSDNEILFTTKPNPYVIKQIVDSFYSYRNLIQFRFTITSINDELLKFWEPNAPSFNERLESLCYAYKNNFKTSVAIEPFLDYDPKKLVLKILPYVTESIWVGPMNYIKKKNMSKEEESYYQNIRKNYTRKNLIKIMENLKDTPLIKYKDSYYNRLNSI